MQGPTLHILSYPQFYHLQLNPWCLLVVLDVDSGLLHLAIVLPHDGLVLPSFWIETLKVRHRLVCSLVDND